MVFSESINHDMWLHIFECVTVHKITVFVDNLCIISPEAEKNFVCNFQNLKQSGVNSLCFNIYPLIIAKVKLNCIKLHRLLFYLDLSVYSKQIAGNFCR